MPLSNQRLFDISTRKQTLVESVKQHEYGLMSVSLFGIRKDLESHIDGLDAIKLGDMTKARLNVLLLNVRQSQSVLWASYIAELTTRLQQFAAVDYNVTRQVYASAIYDDDEAEDDYSDSSIDQLMDDEQADEPTIAPQNGNAATDVDALWSAIKNAPMPANGVFVIPFLAGFSASAQTAIENLIRKGWATNQSVADLRAELFKQVLQGSGGQFQRIFLQGRAAINTSFQHVTSVTNNVITSSLFARYQWHSILDSGTTPICAELNGKIFRYGDGPLPPAHVNCRSHIAPLTDGTPVDVDRSFDQFARRQSTEFRNQIGRPMDIDEYAGAVDLILGRSVSDSTN